MNAWADIPIQYLETDGYRPAYRTAGSGLARRHVAGSRYRQRKHFTGGR